MIGYESESQRPLPACVFRRSVTFFLGFLAFAASAANADVGDSDDQIQEVVVSARHVNESVMTVPESISVLDSTALAKLDIQDFQDYATKIPNLSFQYGTGNFGFAGSRTVAIRGISGVGTTGFYIDDTPVPNSIDPEVVDLARIEVLKGPQGTLYGAGSMGGNVRLVTNAPAFTNEFEYSASTGYTDHAATPDGRATFVANFPVVSDFAATRIVGFVDHQGGFITRTFPEDSTGQLKQEDNQGAVTSYGGSISTLFRITDQFSLTTRVLGQGSDGHGAGNVYAPLPGFHPAGYTMSRESDIQELWSDKWVLPSAVIAYTSSSWNITSSTSFFKEDIYNLEDGTEGTAYLLKAFYGFNPNVGLAGIPWSQETTHNYLNEEIRAAWSGNGPFRAIFGARYAYNRDLNVLPPSYAPGLAASGVWPTDLLWESSLAYAVRDGSIFGEAYYRLSRFELTLGARKFWLREYTSGSIDGLLNSGFTNQQPTLSSENGVSPKVALSYELAKDSIVYASASKGFRPGGPNVPFPSFCDVQQLGLTAGELDSYKSDSLWNYELGVKQEIEGIALTAAAFQMNWSGIQQKITLPVCLFTATTNAGSARIRGVEFELGGHPTREIEAKLGIGYQDPRIENPGLSGLQAGSRILQVPYITGTAALSYTRPLTPTLQGFVSSDFSYVGSSLSTTTVTNFGPLERAGYGLWNARAGAEWGLNHLELYLRNIANVEPNLGDIYPLSYYTIDSHGNPVPRVAIAPPFQIGVQFRRSF